LYNTVSTPPSGDGKADVTLLQSSIVYLKAVNFLNPEVEECLLKPNDWVNSL
jgi:hypothetical protein